MLIAVAGLVAAAATGMTWSAFTASTTNAGNSLQAAASFGEALDHFDIDTIGEQHEGRYFLVTVRAKTASGATMTSYSGKVTFSTSNGTIASSSITNSFLDGVLYQQAVRLTSTGYTTSQTISVSEASSGKTGTSNAFTVHDWRLYLKKTSVYSGSSCSAANVLRDMEEGYTGLDPGETFVRTNSVNTLRSCSRTFSAGEKLVAGTTRVEGNVSTTLSSGTCAITATLYRNGTQALGSNTQTIGTGTGTVLARTWTLTTPDVTFAAGDRLSVVLSWETTVSCKSVFLHYGGTSYRSHLALPGPGGHSYPDAVLGTPGLVSYWRFEQASGATTSPDWKGANTGTYIPPVPTSYPAGLPSNSSGLAVSDTGPVMTVADSTNLSPTSELSIELWLRSGDCCSATLDLVTKDWLLRRDSLADGRHYSFAVNTASGSEPRALSTTVAAASSVPFYLAATYDGSNLKIYVNGVLEGVQPRTGLVIDGSGPLTLGGTGTHVYDELAFYDRALTAAEIKGHRNAR